MLQWLYIKLQYFSGNQVLTLLDYLKTGFKSLDEEQQKDIKFLFSTIKESTPDHILANIVEDITELFLYDKVVTVYRVNKGENFSIVVKQQDPNDNYLGFKLTAREDHTNKLVSDNIDGTDEEFQTITFTDLDLDENNTYLIRLQLEENINNEPSGDAISLLSTLYFVVQKNIDND